MVKSFEQFIYEAVIDWRNEGIEELEARLRRIMRPMPREQFAELLADYGIDVLDYDTFYEGLRDEHKAGAPPRNAGIFALFNPNTNRPQLVISMPVLPPPAIAHAMHMIKHELIHAGQAARRPEHMITGGWDVHDRAAYFSNKDEVMAFSHSIADQLVSQGYREPKLALQNLNRSPLWKEIVKLKLDRSTLNRYRKYIYLYLLQELGNEQ